MAETRRRGVLHSKHGGYRPCDIRSPLGRRHRLPLQKSVHGGRVDITTEAIPGPGFGHSRRVSGTTFEAALLVGLPLDRITLVGPRDPEGRFRDFSDLDGPSSETVNRPAFDP